MSVPSDTVTLRRPDDWHVHLRDGGMLKAVLPFTARQFARAIVMPNLKPPVVDAERARAYRREILAALPPGMRFEPLMTCYLTDRTDPDDLARGFEDGVFTAAKLYPARATTNSEAGVTDWTRIAAVLARMEAIGMPLLIHGEVTDPDIDIFDREAVFIDRVLKPLLDRFRSLRVVLEHITTDAAVRFIRGDDSGRLAATITVHHLMINRSALFAGGIRPHLYCLPIAKRERDRLALRAAATSGDARFFLGTDTAPHSIAAKETACGCAGIFTAPTAIELYAEVFAEEGALDRLEAFASLNGPRFYGLPVNDETITLERMETVVPEIITVGDADAVLPFRSGERLSWRMA